MAQLTAQLARITGTTVALAAVTASDTFQWSEDRILTVANANGAAVTATIVVPGSTRYGQPEPDVAVSIANGTTKDIGPFPRDLADDNGNVTVTYSATTGVTAAVRGVA